MNNINLIDILLMVLIPFIFVVLVIPVVKKIANHIGAIDIPDKRKVHKEPMPRIGGLGIYAGFLLGYILFGEQTTTMNSVLIGSFVLIITGLIDDIKPLKASHKMIGQIIAALIVVFYGGILLKDISFSLEKGEVLSIIGSSGSGKTTILRCINQLEIPDSGYICVDGEVFFDGTAGKESAKERRMQQRLVGLVFQDFHNYITNNSGKQLLSARNDNRDFRKAPLQKGESLL